jgi:hypothetical protein
MRLPRLRFTLKRMMVSVLAVASILAYAERWWRYKRLAAFHLLKAMPSGFPTTQRHGTITLMVPSGSSASRHFEKADEYERAALYPWLSVDPGSPWPE